MISHDCSSSEHSPPTPYQNHKELVFLPGVHPLPHRSGINISMAADFSFDIVSEVDLNIVKDAFNVANKELMNRYDLKGTSAEIEFDGKEITMTADSEFGLNQVKDIVFSKMIKKEIDPKMMEFTDPEESGKIVKQKLTFKQGIATEQAKALNKQIKDSKIKVNSQIQGDALRISGKSKDDLQKTMAFVKGLDLPYAVNFTNYR